MGYLDFGPTEDGSSSQNEGELVGYGVLYVSGAMSRCREQEPQGQELGVWMLITWIHERPKIHDKLRPSPLGMR